MNNTPLKRSHLVLALLAAGVIGGAGVSAVQHVRNDVHAAPTPVAAAPATPAPAASIVLPNFAQIAAQHGGAVVNISVTGTRKVANNGASPFGPRSPRGQQGDDPFGNDPFFEFFRRFQQGRVARAPRRATCPRVARDRASSSAPTA